MDMRNAFPGQHFKAGDLVNGPITLTIAAVVMETIGDDTKPVVKFFETQQDLILNKTNANMLIENFGAESNTWVGGQVQLYATKVQFGADMVDAIRLQIPTAPAQPAQSGVAPFPGTPAPQPAPVQPAPAPGYPPQPVGQPAPVPQGGANPQGYPTVPGQPYDPLG